jgi:hypothetical protein
MSFVIAVPQRETRRIGASPGPIDGQLRKSLIALHLPFQQRLSFRKPLIIQLFV